MRSYAHLSEDERDQIGVLRAAGRLMGAIARALGRAKATISKGAAAERTPFGRVLSSGAKCNPGVTEGARYSFSPSRLCPLETEQKAGVRNGKPDFSLRNQCCRRGCTSRRNPPPARRGMDARTDLRLVEIRE